MTNLFSVFDPASSIMSTQINWVSSLMGMLIIPLNIWLVPSRISTLPSLVLVSLHKEFKMLAHNKGATMLFSALFLFILMNNLMGLIPYIFTSTSHMLTTLSLALPLWLTFMLFGWVSSPNHMFIHLIPQGTPGPLMSFMACIETVSNMIRPGTLAIRLAANMIAGHLLMTLLGSQGPSLPSALIPLLIITQILLLTLETAVAAIQSYVFVVLSVLYSSEVS